MAVVEARLDRTGDAIHHLDRLQWELADGGLTREHDRRGAVEDGVRDVRCLGARGLRLMDHRFEHLGCGDHRAAPLEGARDDPLLEQRHIGGADLDAEISAGNHHRI